MMLIDTTRKAMFHFPSRASEWATALILLNWSVLAYLSHRNSVEDIIPNAGTWAVFFFVLSAVRLVILYVNGTLRLSPHFRSGLSFLSCFAWFQITMHLVNADRDNLTDLAAFPVLLALDFYNAYHVAIEARVTDEGYRNDNRAS